MTALIRFWRHTRPQFLPALSFLALMSMAAPAQSLEVAAAERHVEATLNDILRLIVESPPRAEVADRLLGIVEERSSIEAVARFAAGRQWTSISDAQRAAFTGAFARYMATVYAGYFRRYEGSVEDLRQVVRVAGTVDAGSKGMLVRTAIEPAGAVTVSIDWLVSDRTGRVAIVDLIVGGISMAITQREIVGAMLEKRGGDIDQVTKDLETYTARARP